MRERRGPAFQLVLSAVPLFAMVPRPPGERGREREREGEGGEEREREGERQTDN